MDDAFAHLLMTSVDVVESILIPLNARQLNTCSRVCKFWSGVVSRLKKRRKTKACFMHACGEDDISDLYSLSKLFMQNLYTEPYVVFMMYSSEIDLSYIDDRQEKIDSFIKKLLPNSCKLIALGCGGVVGTDDQNAIDEVEQSMIAVSLLCLPKYDGVEFITSEDIENNFKRETVKFADDVRSACSLQPRAVLTFKSDMTVSRGVGSTLEKHFPDCAIAGAYVDAITPFSTNFPLLQMTAILGDRVHVASVIIDESVMDQTEAENRIKTLKNHQLKEHNSFAFMFACVGRGAGLYEQTNVESSLFRKHFPNTPLIGLFGNGEIGFNHVTHIEPVEKAASIGRPVRIYHSYTSIFVLVSVT